MANLFFKVMAKTRKVFNWRVEILLDLSFYWFYRSILVLYLRFWRNCSKVKQSSLSEAQATYLRIFVSFFYCIAVVVVHVYLPITAQCQTPTSG